MFAFEVKSGNLFVVGPLATEYARITRRVHLLQQLLDDCVGDVVISVQTLSTTIPYVDILGCDDEVPADFVEVDPQVLPAAVVVDLLQFGHVPVEEWSSPVFSSSLGPLVVAHPGPVSCRDEGFLDLVNDVRVEIFFRSDDEEGRDTSPIDEEL